MLSCQAGALVFLDCRARGSFFFWGGGGGAWTASSAVDVQLGIMIRSDFSGFEYGDISSKFPPGPATAPLPKSDDKCSYGLPRNNRPHSMPSKVAFTNAYAAFTNPHATFRNKYTGFKSYKDKP
ncbi:hypothetical protein C8R44DRAFT_741133 [Mycena epipterygia]|nr:hypothetical protein C8R44DRAFT_741133 [Mycena epipterygia]